MKSARQPAVEQCEPTGLLTFMASFRSSASAGFGKACTRLAIIFSTSSKIAVRGVNPEAFTPTFGGQGPGSQRALRGILLSTSIPEIQKLQGSTREGYMVK